ncbi:hypothetical protein LCGC14_0997760 [marine sediment metagenome]|uniref:Uncharacterized protein n=1 Tax=marine sediment metagenome TaxID=412755 RepID=A0A0F9N3Y7_9ZZZZ
MAWWDKIGNGRLVTRAAVTLASATTNIFDVTGGRIILTKIVGSITVIVGGAANVSLQADPTVATSTTAPLCADLDINGYDVGDLLGITGVPTDAMVPPIAGGAIVAPTMQMIIQTGTIEFVCDAAPGGAVLWTVWYQPLDNGASVAAS